MKILVEDAERETSDVYDLSQSNWAGRWACMRDGLVHMWALEALPNVPGSAVRTSGRIWRVLP